MKFRFSEFEFDCEERLLTKNGKLIPLNEKPATLLSLLLTESDKIHNKANILDYVWRDRVITDQVVFQNISHLRVVFGHDAIKTFVKKGYQWQLPLTRVDEALTPDLTPKVTSDVSSAEDTGTESRSKNNNSNTENTNVEKVHLANTTTVVGDIHAVSLDSSAESLGNNTPASTNNPSHNKTANSPWLLGLMLLAGILSTVLLASFWFFDFGEHNINNAAQNKEVRANLFLVGADSAQPLQHSLFNVQTAPTINNQALFDSPFSTWQSLSKSETDIVVAIRQYKVMGDNSESLGTVVRFVVQGKYRGWQGYLPLATEHHIKHQQHKQQQIQLTELPELIKLLTLLAQSDYFFVQSEQIALLALTQLFASQPDNRLVAHQLIEMNYEQGYLDRALAQIDILLSHQPIDLDLGLLQLMKAKVMLRNTQWQQVSPIIQRAIDEFNQLNLPHLEALSWVWKAWYELHNDNYLQVRQALNSAISKARVAREPLLEMSSHIMQSSLASKHGEQLLMQNELDLAKQLFDVHKLNNAHQIPILNMLAASAESASQRLEYFNQILSMPYSPLYRDRFYYAAETVRDELIEQQMWQQAVETIKPWQRPSFALLTQAHIAFSQGHENAGIEFATNAFRQAQVNYVLKDALFAALLLLQQNESGTELEAPNEYVDYIEQNANHKWLRDNKQKLEAISLFRGNVAG